MEGGKWHQIKLGWYLLMVMTSKGAFKNYTEVHCTPSPVARHIVSHYKPTGRILEPCKGDGAFMQYLPQNTAWYEITEGRDFFAHAGAYDWIITNPPYSNLTDWMRHAFSMADNVVFFLPLSKIFSSAPRLALIEEYGAMKNIIHFGPGRCVGLNLGFPMGSVHFKRGYSGGMQICKYPGSRTISSIKEAIV